jgi:ABC-type transporter MlaC component
MESTSWCFSRCPVRRFTCRNETLFALFAAAGAKFRQDGELFLGLRNIAGFDIKLAEVFAGRLVVRLQFQRLGVIGQRRFEVAGLAQGEAEQVVDVGLLGVTRIRWRAAVIATSAAIPALRAMPAPVWFVPRHTRSAAFENIIRERPYPSCRRWNVRNQSPNEHLTRCWIVCNRGARGRVIRYVRPAVGDGLSAGVVGQHSQLATADQEAALDNLSSALSQAGEIIKSSCPASVPLTPIGRLDVAEQRLDATIKAIRMVLLPLERFYETLSDEQRGRFNAMKGSTEGARSPSDMAAMCSQQAGSFIALPVHRIEQVVQPTAQQQSAFDDLKQAAQKVGDQLQSSCPTAVPKSPVARLDTIETRLSAVADAIKAVRPNLKNFYTSLSDDQKARFNMMGPAPLAASPQQ